MARKQPNKQFNLTVPGSLPVRIGTYQRRRMYDRLLIETEIGIEDTILDVGVAADVTYESSNYVEQWYPYKGAITAVGIDDAAFIKQLYGVRFVQASGLHLPFRDRTFDVVHSSAVLEHVGSLQNQIAFVQECCRVACKWVFMTTPNRWFPVEFHTVLPLVHWLPKKTFRAIMRAVEHLLHGHFDVDPEAVRSEGFSEGYLRDGRVYSYWGIFCAVIRLPLLAFKGGLLTDVTRLSCLIAICLAGAMKLRAALFIRRHSLARFLNGRLPS